MNGTHIHLMMTHVPVIGTFVGLGLLIFGLTRKSEELKKTAFGILTIGALLAIPVYLSGEAAENTVKGLPGVLHASVEAHEEAAGVANELQVFHSFSQGAICEAR